MDDFENSMRDWFYQYWIDHQNRHELRLLLDDLATYAEQLELAQVQHSDSNLIKQRNLRGWYHANIERVVNRLVASSKIHSPLENTHLSVEKILLSLRQGLDLVDQRLRLLESKFDNEVRVEKLVIQEDIYSSTSEDTLASLLPEWIDKFCEVLFQEVSEADSGVNILIVDSPGEQLDQVLAEVAGSVYFIDFNPAQAFERTQKGHIALVGDPFYNLLVLTDKVPMRAVIIGKFLFRLTRARRLEFMDHCYARLPSGGMVVVESAEDNQVTASILNAVGFSVTAGSSVIFGKKVL